MSRSPSRTPISRCREKANALRGLDQPHRIAPDSAALRPALTDFARLSVQQFRADPALEAAFLNGYGPDPREPEAWHRNRIREAIGTAVWAYRVHDEPFEQQGHRMIAEALAR
jgi:hypothetical protein